MEFQDPAQGHSVALEVAVGVEVAAEVDLPVLGLFLLLPAEAIAMQERKNLEVRAAHQQHHQTRAKESEG